MLHASMDEDISSHGDLSFICVCTVFRYIYCIYLYAHIYIYIYVFAKYIFIYTVFLSYIHTPSMVVLYIALEWGQKTVPLDSH